MNKTQKKRWGKRTRKRGERNTSKRRIELAKKRREKECNPVPCPISWRWLPAHSKLSNDKLEEVLCNEVDDDAMLDTRGCPGAALGNPELHERVELLPSGWNRACLLRSWRAFVRCCCWKGAIPIVCRESRKSVNFQAHFHQQILLCPPHLANFGQNSLVLGNDSSHMVSEAGTSL